MSGARPWGWHALAPRWAEQLVADSGVGRGALVLDVGAGTGAITGPLLDAGARVVAVEAHPGRARTLRQRFGDRLVVVQADARDLRLPTRGFHVVASPAYDTTTALLKRLLHPGSRLLTAHLVLQDGAARRWVGPDAPGAGRWTSNYEAGLGRRVPRRAFTPPPRVDSRVLTLHRRP